MKIKLEIETLEQDKGNEVAKSLFKWFYLNPELIGLVSFSRNGYENEIQDLVKEFRLPVL